MTCGNLYKLTLASVAISLLLALSACTASGEPEEIAPTAPKSDSGTASSSSGAESSSSESGNGVGRGSPVYDLLRWADFPGGKVKVNSVEFTFNAYSISVTEVTQAAYAEAMGSMPEQPRTGFHHSFLNKDNFYLYKN